MSFFETTAVLEGLMTREEALKRDFKTVPLSRDERGAVLESLGTALIALGCEPERVDAMAEKIIQDINRPENLYYLKALKSVESTDRAFRERNQSGREL